MKIEAFTGDAQQFSDVRTNEIENDSENLPQSTLNCKSCKYELWSLLVVLLTFAIAVLLIPCDDCFSRFVRCNQPNELLFGYQTFKSNIDWKKNLLDRIDNTIKSIEFIEPSKRNYGLLIDLNYDYLEVSLFTWSGYANLTGFVGQIDNCRSDLIIHNLSNLNQSMQALIDCAEKLMKKIPLQIGGPFPLFIGITNQQSRSTQSILNSVKKSLQDASFSGNRKLIVQKMRFLNEIDQTKFSWITVNYLTKSRPDSAGVISMNRLSSNIVFSSLSISGDKIQLSNQYFRINAFTDNCFGTDEALARHRLELLIMRSNVRLTTIIDPCLSADDEAVVINGQDFRNNPCLATKRPTFIDYTLNYTFIGSTNSVACKKLTNYLTNWYNCKCNFQICFNFYYLFQPTSAIYYAISDYYEIFKVLPTISQEKRFNFANSKQLLREIDFWCKQSKFYRIQKSSSKLASQLCFRQYYSYNIIANVYLKDFNWSNIFFHPKLNNFNVGWQLGFLLRETDHLSNEGENRRAVDASNLSGLKIVPELANNLRQKIDYYNHSLQNAENELTQICVNISTVLNVDHLFHYHKCGTNQKESVCCLPQS